MGAADTDQLTLGDEGARRAPFAKFLGHLAAAATVVGALLLARAAPAHYDALMQEDRAVEWATAVLFLAASVVRMRRATVERRAFDALVGLFCFFVAGEEISWGQRLVGYTPPALFLAHNTQQEANLHNFADVFGRPKWILIMALAGYGLLLPVLARWPRTRRLLERVRATPPAAGFVPWFLAAVVLLIWYPITFTGEWVELLSGGLFLAAAPLSSAATAAVFVATVPVALGLTRISDVQRPPDGSALTCARAEVAALVDDVTRGGAATASVMDMASIHKRVWSAIAAGYVDGTHLTRFRGSPCAGAASADALAARRRYAVDPWGTAYWVEIRSDGQPDVRRVVVYSFGPNRRRDGEGGDDVLAEGELR